MNIEKQILKSFNNDELATNVFMQKYALKDDDGNILEYSLEDTKKRMLNAVLEAETEDMKPIMLPQFEECLKYFLSAGRSVYALGNPYDKTSTFFNCYVTEIKDDSIEGIFDTAKKQARIFSKGGGVGFDISKLRPIGSKVDNSAKTTSGAVSFMDLYSNITNIIGQNGRRGALMITMSIDHPEIMDFIKVKAGKDKTKIQYANISVRITNEFMNLLINDSDANWVMEFTTNRGEVIVREEKVSIIWDMLVDSNWSGAEPGILFWDQVIDNDPASVFEETRPISTNPCGEEPLESGGSCNLGSISLSKFVDNSFTDKAEFDFDKFRRIIKLAVRFLDNLNILNINRQPLEENRISLDLGNRIGLGTTGLADMLIKLNLKYDTHEAIEFTDKVFRELKLQTILSSIELSQERDMCGILKKYYSKENYKDWYNHSYFDILNDEQRTELIAYGTRNIGYNTSAPNGSLAIILRTSSGIEPIFSLGYERTVHQAGKGGVQETYTVYHPLVEEYNKIYGKDTHLKNENFITSQEIDWKMRVKIQAVIQKYTSQSISSTVNLPNDTTRDVISNIYKEAYLNNLKGITIYRDGSRDGILKSINADKRQYKILEDYKFPKSGNAKYKILESEDRKWYVTYMMDPETELPISLFVNTNSTETNILTEDVVDHLFKLAKKHISKKFVESLQEKSHKQTNVTKIARAIGLLLRHRIPIIDIVKTIEQINPPIYSFVFQIKKILGEYIEGEYTGDKCPECDNQMIYEGGCSLCRNCGYTKCG